MAIPMDLEPAAFAVMRDAAGNSLMAFAASQAISLKRIADALTASKEAQGKSERNITLTKEAAEVARLKDALRRIKETSPRSTYAYSVAELELRKRVL